ncbi:MAG: phosphatidylglycerophosphatase A [Ignavibacteriaceae bacterium]|nr:phosphatidylglycerophosphatase A [Ignavibacteriaceae bacterium]
MKINFIENAAGSGLFTGYIPVASGTFASLAALLIYLIPGFENFFVIIPAIVISILFGIKIGDKFEVKFGKDPSEYTLDEFIGMWIALIGAPKSLVVLVIAFVIWRVLDIIKPSPAREAEQIKGGKGVIADDIISGIYTLIIMHILYKFIQF